MGANNFTPFTDVIKKQTSQPFSIPKEAEPIPQKEVVIQEAVEHEPEKNLQLYIKKRPEIIELTPELEKMGISASSTSQFPQYQNVKVPLADDKIVSGLNAPVTSSLRWLATLALYILRQAHLGLKVVHGHVVRILKK